MGRITLGKISNFSLKHTVESGQFFQYEKLGEGYIIWLDEDIFYVEQKEDGLNYSGILPGPLKYYLGIDDCYEKIISAISKDKHIRQAIKNHLGMRNMQQSFYECLIGYVCSANSNIPKIRKNVKLLAEFFGEEVEFLGKKYHLFPKPGKLNDLDKILEAKTGFRAKYIYKINKIVDEDWIREIRRKDYKEAKEMLMALPGVGPKIADCVCLFSLHHAQAVPVDVWIRRVVTELYFDNKPVKDEEIIKFMQEYFGKYAGYAAQFLFYFKRKQ